MCLEGEVESTFAVMGLGGSNCLQRRCVGGGISRRVGWGAGNACVGSAGVGGRGGRRAMVCGRVSEGRNIMCSYVAWLNAGGQTVWTPTRPGLWFTLDIFLIYFLVIFSVSLSCFFCYLPLVLSSYSGL